MKKNTLFLLALLTSAVMFGQYDYTVQITNGDIESSTAMSTTNDKNYTIDGFRILENSDSDIFNEASSGLAAGEGVGGSQALKSVVHNSVGASSNVVLFSDRIDISGHGIGDYKFSLQIKTANAPSALPIWLVVAAFDEDGTNVTTNTITKNNGGGTSAWQDFATDFQEAYSEFTVSDNASGKNAKYVELRLQHAKEDNTFWFDDFVLASSAPLSVKSFEAIGVNMYPNPAASFTTIKSTSTLQNITLTSLLGKTLFTQKLDATEFNLDVSSYAKGVYILDVTNEKGKSSTKLIVD